MKKFIKNLLLSTFLFSSIFSTINTIEAKATDLPPVYSEGAILMDGKTGKVLFSKNEHTQFEPASTTKVMTALIVLEHTNLKDKVTIGENPPLVDGSAIGIREGEVYTVEELMLGLLLESGNDCAEALAEYVAGSNKDFAKLMNAKAKELGALNTTFKNPSGLHEDGHLTTAYDLALIMKEAAHNEDFVRIAQTESYKYVNQPFSDGSEKWATNRNQLFNEYSPYFYDKTYCGKNGYTPEANHSYTAAATKGDDMLIGAFLGATDKDNFYTNVGPLFNYGFDNFETLKLISSGDILYTYKINDDVYIPLTAKSDFYYTKAKSEAAPNLSLDYEKTDISRKNIKTGDIIYKAKINVNGETVSSMDLISAVDREYSTSDKIKDAFHDFLENPMSIMLAILAVVILYIIIRMFLVSRRRKNLKRKKDKLFSR